MKELSIIMPKALTDLDEARHYVSGVPDGYDQPLVLDFCYTLEASPAACDALVAELVSRTEGVIIVRNCFERVNELLKAVARNRKVFYRFRFSY